MFSFLQNLINNFLVRAKFVRFTNYTILDPFFLPFPVSSFAFELSLRVLQQPTNWEDLNSDKFISFAFYKQRARLEGGLEISLKTFHCLHENRAQKLCLSSLTPKNSLPALNKLNPFLSFFSLRASDYNQWKQAKQT